MKVTLKDISDALVHLMGNKVWSGIESGIEGKLKEMLEDQVMLVRYDKDFFEFDRLYIFSDLEGRRYLYANTFYIWRDSVPISEIFKHPGGLDIANDEEFNPKLLVNISSYAQEFLTPRVTELSSIEDLEDVAKFTFDMAMSFDITDNAPDFRVEVRSFIEDDYDESEEMFELYIEKAKEEVIEIIKRYGVKE